MTTTTTPLARAREEMITVLDTDAPQDEKDAAVAQYHAALAATLETEPEHPGF